MVEHQAKYLSAVIGGPASYTEAQLHEIHADLGVTRADFEEMLELLRAALEDNGFQPEDIESIMRHYHALRRVIVTR